MYKTQQMKPKSPPLKTSLTSSTPEMECNTDNSESSVLFHPACVLFETESDGIPSNQISIVNQLTIESQLQKVPDSSESHMTISKTEL